MLSSPSEIKVPPPPAGAAAAEQDEVERLARLRKSGDSVEVFRWRPDRPIRPWLDLNIELARTTPNTPPRATRGYALTSVAISDAVTAAWHWKDVYRRAPPAGVETLGGPAPGSPLFSYPSEHAVIAGAASRVLKYLFPTEPSGSFDQMAQDTADSRVLAGTNFRSDVEAGLALGRAVAAKVIARARIDGSEKAWDGHRPQATAAVWSPPPDAPNAAPVDPGAGRWKPWLMGDASKFRPVPPAAYGSAAFRDEVGQMRESSAFLDQGQLGIAVYWAANPRDALLPPVWAEEADNWAREAGFDILRTARVLAALHVAQHDATLAVWDAAYTYWRQSPVNAIRDLTDYAEWTPALATPASPPYPSNFAAYAGVAEVVLRHVYPNEARGIPSMVTDAVLSRVWGGVNYPSDNAAGLDLGRKIGRLALRRLP